jgi:putative transposase
VLLDGAIYHVTSEIDHGATALEHADAKQMFLDFVETAKEKFSFELLNFTVMDNHIQLLIKPGKTASLSEIMQWIKGNAAKKWNKMHGTKGHVWGERFFSRIISDETDLAQTSTDIDDDPVKENLVKKAKDWKFGGMFHKVQRIIWLVDILPEDGLFPTAAAPAPG